MSGFFASCYLSNKKELTSFSINGVFMSVFKKETETKRVIFNVRLDLAERLEKAKEEAKELGKKLDIDTTIDKALEKFLKKAEKRMQEIKKDSGKLRIDGSSGDPSRNNALESEEDEQ